MTNTPESLTRKKAAGEPIAVLTCYDYPIRPLPGRGGRGHHLRGRQRGDERPRVLQREGGHPRTTWPTT